MSILATEDFAGSGALSANWTQTILAGSGRSTRASDQLQSATVLAAFERRNDVSWPDDQVVTLVIKATTSGADEGSGPAGRISTSGAGTGYFVQAGATDTRLYKVVAGAFTQLGTTGGGVAANDVIELSLVGSTITVKKNGAAFLGTPLTDAAIASGAAGFWTAPSPGTTDLADDWNGSDTATVPVITAQPQGAAAAVGATATYAITATGATSYQWQVSTNGGQSWASESGGSGGTTASYTTPAAVAGDSGKKYRCVATNAGGSTNSLDVYFHVSGLPSAADGRRLATSAPFTRVDNRYGPPSSSPFLLLQTKSVVNLGRDFAAARNLFFFGTPAGADLAGAAAAQAAASGALNTGINLAGNAAAAASATGNLTANSTPPQVYAPRLIASRRARPGRGPYSIGRYFRPDTRYRAAGGPAAALAGAATAQAAAGGALTTGIRLNGVALVVANAAGALSTGINLAGSAAAVVVMGGDLTAQIRLNGAAVAQALAAAGLTTQIILAAAAQAQAAASGALSTQIALAGNAAGQATAAGSLGAPFAQLAGDAQGRAAASGNLTTAIALGGNAAAAALAAASLTAQIRLDGAAIAQALAAAGLATAINLAGNAAAVVTASGTLLAPVGLVGAAVAQAQAAGSLSTAIRLQGAAAAQAQATGTLGIPIALAGAAAAVVTGTGALTVSIQLNAAALAQVLATGDLVAHINLSGAALAQAAASGSLALAYVPALLPRYRVGRGHRDFKIREAA